MNNEKKIKILQINKLYYPWIGGVERVVQNIAEGLQHRVDMKVLVCRSRGRSVVEQVNNVEIVRASSLGIFFSMPVSLSFPFYLNEISRDRDILAVSHAFPACRYRLSTEQDRGEKKSWYGGIATS